MDLQKTYPILTNAVSIFRQYEGVLARLRRTSFSLEEIQKIRRFVDFSEFVTKDLESDFCSLSKFISTLISVQGTLKYTDDGGLRRGELEIYLTDFGWSLEDAKKIVLVMEPYFAYYLPTFVPLSPSPLLPLYKSQGSLSAYQEDVRIKQEQWTMERSESSEDSSPPPSPPLLSLFVPSSTS